MDLIDRATVLHYHRHRIRSHGVQAIEALGWREEASQSRRFEQIARSADFSHSTVLDLGCGRGELKAYLSERFEGLSYLGVDQQPEFIAAARERYAHDPEAAFIEADFSRLHLPRVDHVLACGALGYRSRNPLHLNQTIARMFACARRTVVFNVLDARHFPADHPLLLGRDVEAVRAFCLQLCPRVELIQGYAPDDASFILRLEEGEPP